MKLLLQSHDRFDEFAEFNTETSETTLYSKAQNSERWANGKAGFFAQVNAKPAVLFRVGHDLFFCYSGKRYSITDETYARVEGGEIERTFTLAKGEQPILRIDYEVAKSPIPPEVDFTQTDPEHFDFLLFVRNLLQDTARRKLTQGFPEE